MITPALGLPAVSADTIDFPHGTVSAYVDKEEGVLRIFWEPQPHPEDVEEALALAYSIAGGGWTFLGTADVTETIIQIIHDPLRVVA